MAVVHRFNGALEIFPVNQPGDTVKLKLVASTIACVAVVALSASPASAASSQSTSHTPDQVRDITAQVYASPDPSAAFNKLDSATQGEVTRALSLVAVDESVTTTPVASKATQSVSSEALAAADACFVKTAESRGKNAVGQTLYLYTSQLQYCATNGKWTSAKYLSRTGQAKFPGWRYVGLVSNVGGARLTSSVSISAFTQFNFKLDPIKSLPLQQVTPCQRIKVDRNGQTALDNSCYF